MSGLDNRLTEVAAARAAAARAAVIAADRRRQGEAAALVYAALAFGEATRKGPLAHAVAAARAFCIIAAGVIPVALFWTLAIRVDHFPKAGRGGSGRASGRP